MRNTNSVCSETIKELCIQLKVFCCVFEYHDNYGSELFR